ncbi:Ribosome quality control complex subunit 1 [Candida albicans]
MSSRALRRLERQKLENELSISPEPERNGNDESDFDDSPISKPKANAFALLNDGDNETDDEENSDNDNEEDESTEQTRSTPKQPNEPPKNKNNKKKQQQKKATTNKKKQQNKIVDEYGDDEFDKILEQMRIKDDQTTTVSVTNQKTLINVYDFEEELDEITTPTPDFDSNFKAFTTNRLKKSLSLLSIKSVGSLDQDNEYKNLFGNLSMNTIEDANSTTSMGMSPEMLQQFKRLAKLTRGWGGKDRRGIPGTTRKLIFSKIKDDWLPTTLKPLNMEEIKPDDYVKFLDYKEDTADLEELQLKINKEVNLGVKYFQFSKINNIKERVANTRFYASVVMSPDPESLMQQLQQYPYHVETLLQVAMVLLRQGDNKSTSNALVERALFAFDRSLHKGFHELLYQASNGLARLPYERFMNRQFYLCLFRYITALGERSTFYTALAYCKLLLSLSPAEDPLGVRYFIDFYALMSEEWKYMVQFAESPLVTTYTRWYTPGIAFSTVLAHLKLNQEEKARGALKKAFEAHPYTAYKLYKQIGLSNDLSLSEGSFKIDTEVEIATETYLVRCTIMWNDQSHRQFLHDELEKLFSDWKLQNSNNGVFSSILGSFGFKDNKKESNNAPFNLLRFAILSGENKIMAKLPQQLWSRNDIFEYDILPPKQDEEQTVLMGLSKKDESIVDHLLDYVDQNLLGSIIQSRTADEGNFDEIIRGLELQNVEEAENQQD